MSLVWRYRIVIARDKTRRLGRWHWAVEEQKGFRGSEYRLIREGRTFTRAAAVRESTRAAFGFLSGLDRVELQVAARQPVKERPDPKPTPLPVELLDPEGAE